MLCVQETNMNEEVVGFLRLTCASSTFLLVSWETRLSFFLFFFYFVPLNYPRKGCRGFSSYKEPGTCAAGRMGGWMGGWMGRWMDGWMGGRKSRQIIDPNEQGKG